MPIRKLKTVQKLSESMGLDPAIFVASRVLDPILGVDVKMFVDPQLLIAIDIPEFRGARAKLEKYFADTFKLLSISTSASDMPALAAVRRLTFREIKGVGIGFGKDTDDGRGIGLALAEKLVRTAAEIQKLGNNDPTIFELLGLFEDDFGPDRLSDLTLVILREEFLSFTDRVASEMGLMGIRPHTERGRVFQLPFRTATSVPLTLLPLDLLRDLPIATDQSEISEASRLNQELREYWRGLLAEAFKAGKPGPGKSETRVMFLTNPSFFPPLIKVYREEDRGPYDFATDPKGLLNWADFALEYAARFPLNLRREIRTLDQLEEVVRAIIEQFKRNIELNGLSKLLYSKQHRPHREAYAQLLFFASADAYCRANGLDLSPESDAGRGPVDFKISRGALKVVVELKLSRHKKLIHGFTEQLRIYRQSENAQRAYYVVVRVAESLPAAFEEIQRIIREENALGHSTNKFIQIDGRIQPSASRDQKRPTGEEVNEEEEDDDND